MEKEISLKKEGERLIAFKNGTKLRDIPILNLEQVVIIGNVNLTSPVIALLLENNIEICYLSYYGRFRGRLMPEFSKNSLLRIKQYSASRDDGFKVKVARQFIYGKLANMRTMLMRYNRELKDERLTTAINRIKVIIKKLEKAETLDSLRGYEGGGSGQYFSVLPLLFKDDWRFSKRVRRPPTDPVNSLLSLGYTLLMNDMSSAVNTVGFDPYIGYLHADKYGKPSLVLDLIEEFRPVIVDSIVLELLNRHSLKMKDFVKNMEAYYLTNKGMKIFLSKYEERKNTKIIHPTFGYKATLKRCLELQARLFSKLLLSDIDNYMPFMVK